MRKKGPFERLCASIVVEGSSAYLTTKAGLTTVVDFEDLQKINNGSGLYISASKGKDKRALIKWRERNYIVARLIMEPAHGLVVDHINGDTLDNRKQNLRVCTGAQNMMNRKPNAFGKNRVQTHPYKGVRYNSKLIKPFLARVMVKKKEYCSAGFDTAEEAAREYDRLAKIHHGEFARLNFPD